MPTKKKAAPKKITKVKKPTKVVIKKAAPKKVVKKVTLTQAPEPTEMVKFVLRIDPKLHQQLKKAAKDNNTSMNREISNILKDAAGPSKVIRKLDEILALVK